MTITLVMDGIIQPEVVEIPGTRDTHVFAITRSWRNHSRWEWVSRDPTTGKYPLNKAEDESIAQYCIGLTANDDPIQRIRGLSFALQFAQAQQRQLPTAIVDTLVTAFDNWIKLDSPSLDAAFVLPKRTPKRLAQKRRRRQLEEKIWSLVVNEHRGRPKDKALFEEIGRAIGLGGTKTDEYFRKGPQRKLQNYLNGGPKVGRPRKNPPHSAD